MDLWVKWDYLLAYSTDKCKKNKQVSCLSTGLLFPWVIGHIPLCVGLLFLWGRGSRSFFVVLDLQGEASLYEGGNRGGAAVVKCCLLQP